MFPPLLPTFILATQAYEEQQRGLGRRGKYVKEIHTMKKVGRRRGGKMKSECRERTVRTCRGSEERKKGRGG